MPFDRFIREQLAGDLLPAPTTADARRQLTATAFLALGPTNYEEQDKQQLRFDVIDEQLETLGRTFLGQTIGCARCHDHKFDPIPQRDYYALAGILASTRTLYNYTDNVARWIAAPLPVNGEAETALRAYEAKVAAVEKALATAKADLAEASKAVSQGTSGPGKSIAVVVGIWRSSTTADAKRPKLSADGRCSKHVAQFYRQWLSAPMTTRSKGEKTVTSARRAHPKTGQLRCAPGLHLSRQPCQQRAGDRIPRRWRGHGLRG